MNKTQKKWNESGKCTNCGKVPVTKFKWCYNCRIKINGNYRYRRKQMNKVYLLIKGKYEEYYEPHGPYTKIGFEGEDITVGDDYHTLDELYDHRNTLFIALCKIYDNYITPLNTRVKCWKSYYHSDGTTYDKHFILGMTITEFEGPPKQITYHLPNKYWDKINVLSLGKAPDYDGHTSDDVLKRLIEL